VGVIEWLIKWQSYLPKKAEKEAVAIERGRKMLRPRQAYSVYEDSYRAGIVIW